ncbi:MAG: hypothetical protein ACI86M_003819 [Saprospiraceae bacterium]|jgi:hypothetical protein
MTIRIKVEDRRESTITYYVRAVQRPIRFHDLIHPLDLDIDQILHIYFNISQQKQQFNLRINKRS